MALYEWINENVMKKVLFILLSVACAIGASAQFKFQSIDNFNGKTTIVIVDDNFTSGSETCCARFYNDGKCYEAKSMVSQQEGNVLTITMTFKRMTLFSNTSLALSVNGQTVRVPIDLSEVVAGSPNCKILLP